MDELFKHKGFKLISLDLRNNNLLGTISYNFIESADKQDAIYTSVIIGANGTGKSNLFRIIIWLFKELYDQSHEKGRSYSVEGLFNLKYPLNGDIIEYTNMHYSDKERKFLDLTAKNTAYLLVNGKNSKIIKKIFPIALVAVSIMLTDKFPIYNDAESFPIYKYLGVRNRPQLASTRSYVRKTVEFIVEQINSEAFKKGLQKTANFLGINNSIDVLFYTQNTTTFFKGELDSKVLIHYFRNIEKTYKATGKTPPFKLNHFQSIETNTKLLSDIASFCNKLFEDNRLLDNYRSSSKTISYNVVDDISHYQLKREYRLLEHLRMLGMVYAPEIKINNGRDYNLQESSSGEYHFFSTMVGLMATIVPNSLIFIDEPEISLHPRWQMRYLSFLQELFSGEEYATCHLIIASHSHFIISDLKGKNSKIIGLTDIELDEEHTKTKRKIKVVNLPKNIDTYGWAAEDVLYNIFGVTSSRNFYFQADITDLLGIISNNLPEFEKLNEIIGRIEALNLHENDPARLVVADAKNYIANYDQSNS